MWPLGNVFSLTGRSLYIFSLALSVLFALYMFSIMFSADSSSGKIVQAEGDEKHELSTENEESCVRKTYYYLEISL